MSEPVINVPDPQFRSRRASASNKENSGKPSDLEFVSALIGGCEEAWNRLVNEYAGLVRSRVACVAAACGLPVDNALVDDLVAEVFTALLNNDASALRGFAGRSTFATYLSVIASRVAIRKSIRASQQKKVTIGEVTAEPQDSAELPENQIMSSEERKLMSEEIKQLPSRQRDLVTAVYLDGMSYQQASQSTGIPIGSIGPTLKRAEQRLRQNLSKNNLTDRS